MSDKIGKLLKEILDLDKHEKNKLRMIIAKDQEGDIENKACLSNADYYFRKKYKAAEELTAYIHGLTFASDKEMHMDEVFIRISTEYTSIGRWVKEYIKHNDLVISQRVVSILSDAIYVTMDSRFHGGLHCVNCKMEYGEDIYDYLRQADEQMKSEIKDEVYKMSNLRVIK